MNKILAVLVFAIGIGAGFFYYQKSAKTNTDTGNNQQVKNEQNQDNANNTKENTGKTEKAESSPIKSLGSELMEVKEHLASGRYTIFNFAQCQLITCFYYSSG